MGYDEEPFSTVTTVLILPKEYTNCAERFIHHNPLGAEEKQLHLGQIIIIIIICVIYFVGNIRL